VQSQGGTKSFEALLKLRQFTDERGVPVLETILNKNIGTGNIFGFASAQALFCIGSPRAHEILKRHLLTPNYSAPMGMRYTFYWQMPQAKRDAFITQYHLTSTSMDLGVEFTAQQSQQDPRKFEFHVVVRNLTDKPIRIHSPKVYLGRMLVMSDSDGHFVQNLSNVKYKTAITKESFPELPAHGELEFIISAEARLIDSRGWKKNGLSQPEAMVLDCGDVFHAIGESGKVTVRALYSVEKRFAQGLSGRLGLSQVWTGRVVSRPLEIDVP